MDKFDSEDHGDYRHREMKQAVANLLEEFGDKWLTLNANAPRTTQTMKKCVGRFFARVDRSLLGRNFYKKTDERSNFVCVIENVGSNIHGHCLGNFADGFDDITFRALEKQIAKCWRSVVPSGTINLQNAYDIAGAASYSVKQFRGGTIDRYVFTREFWPNQR